MEKIILIIIVALIAIFVFISQREAKITSMNDCFSEGGTWDKEANKCDYTK